MKSEIASKYGQAIFTSNSGNKQQSIIAANVVDFYFAGSKIFQSTIIDRLYHVFAIKSKKVAKFQYIGLDIKKNNENINLG